VNNIAIELFDIESNELIRTFNCKTVGYRVKCIKYLPDNMLICGTENGLIKILNIETSKCIQTISAHTGHINDILLISDKTFLTCSQDNTIKHFDLDTFACVRTFTGHSQPVFTINKFSTNKFISTSWDCTTRIWNLNKSKCIKVIVTDSCGDLIVISDKIIISKKDKSLVVWNVETGKTNGEIKINDENVINFIKLSNNKIASLHNHGLINIWDIYTQKCLKTIETIDKTWCLAKLSKSSIVLGNSVGIQILDIESGDCIKTLDGQKGKTECIDLF
jgi:WD40 repeat protein